MTDWQHTPATATCLDRWHRGPWVIRLTARGWYQASTVDAASEMFETLDEAKAFAGAYDATFQGQVDQLRESLFDIKTTLMLRLLGRDPTREPKGGKTHKRAPGRLAPSHCGLTLFWESADGSITCKRCLAAEDKQ